MEGFMHWRIRPWLRRLITRMLAVGPAVLIVALRPEAKINDLYSISARRCSACSLPLAMFPLMHFTSSENTWATIASAGFCCLTGWGSCLLITVLDIYTLPGSLQQAWAVIARSMACERMVIGSEADAESSIEELAVKCPSPFFHIR